MQTRQRTGVLFAHGTSESAFETPDAAREFALEWCEAHHGAGVFANEAGRQVFGSAYWDGVRVRLSDERCPPLCRRRSWALQGLVATSLGLGPYTRVEYPLTFPALYVESLLDRFHYLPYGADDLQSKTLVEPTGTGELGDFGVYTLLDLEGRRIVYAAELRRYVLFIGREDSEPEVGLHVLLGDSLEELREAGDALFAEQVGIDVKSALDLDLGTHTSPWPFPPEAFNG
jgi:hypothetical protein